MTAPIDHKQRKQLIVTRSIILFAEQGYNGVTYQKIADACGLSRTILYNYFPNKREIFGYVIDDLNRTLEKQYTQILKDRSTPLPKRIEKILNATITLLFKEHIFMSVVLDYILAAHREGRPIKAHIRRYTTGVLHVLRRLLREGIAAGSIKPCACDIAAQDLYTLLESTILRLTISLNANFRQLQNMIRQAVTNLTV